MNEELIALLQGFRATLAANQATHQATADTAQTTITTAQTTLEEETANVAGYTDALADIDAEIAKLSAPAPLGATKVVAGKSGDSAMSSS